MARGVATLFLLLAVVAVAAPSLSETQPPTADRSIAKDRTFRLLPLKSGRNVASSPKLGFFGTIFHLILEQVNDTKSAYNQISELVNNQFSDGTEEKLPPIGKNNETTTESSKISRSEFLQILDRNLKGLARLRALEWREARKDSWSNLQRYKDEILGKQKPPNNS